MPFRCMYCSGNHGSSSCPQLNDITSKLQESVDNPNIVIPRKCCNCGSDGHFATDPVCPNKIKYIESRKKLASKGRTNQKRFVNDINSFPPLAAGGSSSRFPESFAAVINTPSIPFPNSNFNFPNSSYRTDSPFSYEEVISLTSDILNHFKNLQSISREQVISTIMQLSMKYLFNHG